MLHMLLDKTFESDYKNTWNDSSKTVIDISQLLLQLQKSPTKEGGYS